jgi:hypothetical protein
VFVARVFYASGYFRGVVWSQGAAVVVYAVVAFPLRATWGTTGLAVAFGVAELAASAFAVGLAARRVGLPAARVLATSVAPVVPRAAVVVAGLVAARFALDAGVASSAWPRLLVALLVASAGVAAALLTSGWAEVQRARAALRL